MNNTKEVRNFYEQERMYEDSINETKQVIQKIISIDFENLKSKIDFLDTNKQYNEYIYLLNAVIGRNTSKYYFCKDEEVSKYYGLELGKIYELEKLNIELQVNKNKVLDIKGRVILAEKLFSMTEELIDIFKQNLLKTDNSFSTIDTHIITQNDINYFENLISYLNLIMDKSARLKILVAEKDVYSLEKAKQDYTKKLPIQKFFHKLLKNEDKVINNMAIKNKNMK